jgi:glycosyltransferase involved in cell wall biosynthesis
MILSIIMITIPERAERFNWLKNKVQKQISECQKTHRTLGQIEIVEVMTPKFKDGGGSIGRKRQTGLDQSKGEYVCWLDDDDDIAPNYVEEVVRMANKGADVCTFSSMCRFDNFWMVAEMHFNTKHDDQARPAIIKRRPWHVCAFRRGVLEGVNFPDANWDEDTKFIEQALKNCRTFAHSEAILHEYRRLETSYSENNESIRR